MKTASAGSGPIEITDRVTRKRKESAATSRSPSQPETERPQKAPRSSKTRDGQKERGSPNSDKSNGTVETPSIPTTNIVLHNRLSTLSRSVQKLQSDVDCSLRQIAIHGERTWEVKQRLFKTDLKTGERTDVHSRLDALEQKIDAVNNAVQQDHVSIFELMAIKFETHFERLHERLDDMEEAIAQNAGGGQKVIQNFYYK